MNMYLSILSKILRIRPQKKSVIRKAEGTKNTNFCRPSSVIVTSPYKLDILERDV